VDRPVAAQDRVQVRIAEERRVRLHHS
jgi:hypothetical protein